MESVCWKSHYLNTVDSISALSDNGNIVTLYCIISMRTSFAYGMKSCRLLNDHLLKHAEFLFALQNNALSLQHRSRRVLDFVKTFFRKRIERMVTFSTHICMANTFLPRYKIHFLLFCVDDFTVAVCITV